MAVSRETMERLELYKALLVKWNKAINLVSPGTINEAWQRHFEDSIQISDLIAQNAKIADLGSGAGFPGLVLAIIRPDLDIHLIESDNRKCQFLKTVSRETSARVEIHNARVEEVLKVVLPDLITARAFKSVQEILDFAAPVLEQKPDLEFILLKGRKAEEEIKKAQSDHDFACKFIPSVTDPEAAIVRISNVHKRA